MPRRKISLIVAVIVMAFSAPSFGKISDQQFTELCKNASPIEIIRAINDGANKNAKNEYGVTALMIALTYGNIPAADILLQINADVKAKSDNGNSAIICAKHPEHVKILLLCGADPNDSTNDGSNALTRAAISGYAEIVDILLKAGANPNAQDNKGYTALMFAADFSHLGIVNSLINAGADISLRTQKGYDALMESDMSGNNEALNAMLKAGANVKARDNDGNTAMMLAAKYCHPETVNTLLQAGSDINARNNAGATALIIAANGTTAYTADTADTVNALMNAGANVKARDKSGKMALDCARANYYLKDTGALKHLEELSR